MRLTGLGVLLLCAGCSSAVSRLEGEVKTPAGSARTECEEQDWLVLAPTRSAAVSPGGTDSAIRDDALGLYDVGGRRPKSITRLERHGLGPSPLLPPHREGTRTYDRDRVLSTSLGGVGMVLMGIGAAVFGTAFETVQDQQTREEELQINKGRATAGAIVIGLGLGFGISGLALTPSPGERIRAQGYRYTFVPENDPPEEVAALVATYNEDVRHECARGDGNERLGDEVDHPAEASEADPDDEAPDTTDADDESSGGLETDFDGESNEY